MTVYCAIVASDALPDDADDSAAPVFMMMRPGGRRGEPAGAGVWVPVGLLEDADPAALLADLRRVTGLPDHRASVQTAPQAAFPRAVAISDRWSWSMLRQRYSQGSEPGLWWALEQRSPERFLAHEHREALEWLLHRGLIEVAPDFTFVRICSDAEVLT